MTVKFIKPDPIKLGDVTKALDLGLQAGGEIVKSEFALFTGTWEQKNQPNWTERKPGSSSITLTIPSGGGSIRVTDRVWSYTTQSNIMVWVDDGTKPHIIRPKKAGFLAFQTGFIAKTKPSQIMSGPGANFGLTAFAKEVHHPGTDPRNISNKIGENADGYLAKMIQDALDREDSL